MALLTLVVPTFNRPDYLADCLESIASQTCTDFDLVVLDNASTASYDSVLERFAHLNIEYIKNDENIGAGNNHRKARDIARRSKYALVFHDDDLMHPRMIEWELDLLEGQDDLCWAAAEDTPFNDGQTPPADRWDTISEPVVERYETRAELARRLLQGARLNYGSVMFRSAALTDIPYRIEEFEIVADRVFLLDIAAQSPTALIAEPLVLYRHHAAQDTHNPVFREQHALALMSYYSHVLPEPHSNADATTLLQHSTNYLLHARAMVPPSARQPFSAITRGAAGQGLFSWSRIDGQGVSALARMAGLGGAFERIRPTLGKIKRSVRS
ncbi:MAG: glycosyltransferase [Coriobacteriia bacterium]|nr:glycosyltransferase [Coriobacteriia bacterium]